MEDKLSKEKNMKEDFKNQVKLVHDELFIFLYSFIHEEELTKDVLQNTLITAYKHYTSLKEKSKFKSWIFTIGKREALRILKKTKRYVVKEVNDWDMVMSDDPEMIPENLIINQELKTIIIQAINHLNKNLREIIILKYYHDISFEQISKMYHINVNTVRTRHMRAKKKINDFLLKNYYRYYK